MIYSDSYNTVPSMGLKTLREQHDRETTATGVVTRKGNEIGGEGE
jgi:hypothetical protein